MTNQPDEGSAPREAARDPFAPPHAAYPQPRHAAPPAGPEPSPQPAPTWPAPGQPAASSAEPPAQRPAPARGYASGYPSGPSTSAGRDAGLVPPYRPSQPQSQPQPQPQAPYPTPPAEAREQAADGSAAAQPAAGAAPTQPPASMPAYRPPAYGPPAAPAFGHAVPSAYPTQPTHPTQQTHAAAPGAQAQPGYPPYQPPFPPAPRLPYPDLDPEPRRRRTLSLVWVVPLLVLALVAGLVGGLLGSRLTHDDRLVDAGLPAAPAGGAAAPRASDSVAGIAAEVLPSVVSIQVSGAQGQATGSGFVLRQDGYILTNNHVVTEGSDATASSIVVTFGDGTEKKARVVGRTPDYDLAVVKVDVKGLTPLALGDSDKVVVGDPVVAVGAPLGLAGTVTTGIVSALNRPVSAGGEQSSDTAFINAIQTDAAINPGNSGGPLVDGKGQVIGINSAIAQPPGTSSSSGGSIGLGFAIPSNQARRTAEQLIETGHATYPVIGVLLDQRYSGQGVRVATGPQNGQAPVTDGGPADRAGIRSGDVILSIDGRPVTDPDELVVAIRARTPGDTVVLRVRSGSADARDVRVKLDESQSD
jgi:putative serine protease PepD